MTQTSALLAIAVLLVSLASLADSSWRQMLQVGQRGDATSRQLEQNSWSPFGLRRIQRGPKLIDDFAAPTSSLMQSYQRAVYDKRSFNSLDEAPASGLPRAGSHEFLYVIAPISEQALPFQRSKVDEGYKNFVNLAGPNYKTGLQRVADELGSSLEEQSKGILASGGVSSTGCRANKSKIRLARDEFDPATGQLVRQCAGLVELSSCEGECVSSIQPSVKAPGGFIKSCFCCNEGSLRKVLVRLHECRLASGQSREVSGPRQPSGYMDVLVDEPTDCKCRPCDTLI